MARNHASNIITNRQLNFTLSPVDMHNQKSMPYDLPNYSIDGTWNQHQSIILDLLLDFYVKNLYEKFVGFPKSWRSEKVLSTRANLERSYAPIDQATLLYLSKQYAESYFEIVGSGAKDQIIAEHQKSLADGESISFEDYLAKHLKNDQGYRHHENEMANITNGFHKDFGIQFDISNLFKKYPVLSKYRYTFEKHLDIISSTKFKMNYKVKYVAQMPRINGNGWAESRGQLGDIYYKMHHFEEILNASIQNEKLTINFKTPLGKLIVMNSLMLDTDWIGANLFSLKKNAYFIYKRFILNRVAGKNKPKSLDLWFDDLKDFLNLNWTNKHGIHQIIDTAFSDMREAGLIASHTWNKNYVKQRQYQVSF